jgi:hypothetical protein
MINLSKLALVAGVLMSLGLTACAKSDPDRAAPDAQCQREAELDPEVKAAEQQQIMNTLHGQVGTDVGAAVRKQKVLACLRARGLTPPGGVQKLQP